MLVSDNERRRPTISLASDIGIKHHKIVSFLRINARNISVFKKMRGTVAEKAQSWTIITLFDIKAAKFAITCLR